MSLGHVYIVLEPVGSARLTFGDDRYYEFMCFDVPKVVQSPGCDHGHDEESRNGRDIKIGILDGYVRTREVFQIKLVCQRVIETPREKLWALGAIRRKHTSPQGAGAPPLGRRPNWKRFGGPSPPFLLLSSSFLLLLVGIGKGGKPTWSRIAPPWARLLLGRPSPPPLLYIRGRGPR